MYQSTIGEIGTENDNELELNDFDAWGTVLVENDNKFPSKEECAQMFDSKSTSITMYKAFKTKQKRLKVQKPNIKDAEFLLSHCHPGTVHDGMVALENKVKKPKNPK